MTQRLPVHKLKTDAKALNLGDAKVYHLPDWHGLSHPDRLGVIRQIAMMRGRDPRIARLAVEICRKAKAPPRQYTKQAAAILKWVQDPKNIYYVNEPGERLQDPIYTIKVGHADCDDQVLVLCALFESIGLPWKLCLSGRNAAGNKVRHIEGQPVTDARWSHIYCMVGDRPFRPSRWFFCEPTVDGVPLGWDVVSGDSRYLPEMARKKVSGPAKLAKLKPPPTGHKPGKYPRASRRSPAYDYGDIEGGRRNPMGNVSSAVGASVAEAVEGQGLNWTRIWGAVATGVAVSVFTTLALDWVKGEGMWKGKGTVTDRWGRTTVSLAQQSVLSLPSPLKGR